MSVLCHLAKDACLRSCTPTQILCVVLVTPPASLHCFSHFPRRKKSRPSLHGTCCRLQRCACGDEVLRLCEALVVWNAHVSSAVARGPGLFRQPSGGEQNFLFPGCFQCDVAVEFNSCSRRQQGKPSSPPPTKEAAESRLHAKESYH